MEVSTTLDPALYTLVLEPQVAVLLEKREELREEVGPSCKTGEPQDKLQKTWR